MIDTLSGLAVQESVGLTGSKYAVQCGNTLLVSPAMWSLLRDATQDELGHLLANILVRQLPPKVLAGGMTVWYHRDMLDP